MDARKYVILTAGGVGKRMKSSLPKQFLEISGIPILRLTIEAFRKAFIEKKDNNEESGVEIVLVMHPDYIDKWKDYCKKESYFFKHYIVSGGLTRFHSVQNALKFLQQNKVGQDWTNTLIAVHDGVRPFITPAKLKELFSIAEGEEALIPILKIVDSMRKVLPDGNTLPVNRDEYITIQTPQIFRGDVLMESYKLPYLTSYTDDASIVEKAGYKLTYTEGERTNLKITVPEDLISIH
ncbi:MAG: IspD/TarI family cytidylyltransferase [Bacteroidales bacterium]